MTPKKSFVYLIRTDRPEVRLLVFDSLDEPGFEVPKGTIEEGETFEDAAIREVCEEAGITGIRFAQELGGTWYGGEEQCFFLVEAPEGLPNAFEHTVTGDGVDRGSRYAFRWLPVDPALRGKLVQGCGAFVEVLVDAVSRHESAPVHSFGRAKEMERSTPPITSVRNARIVEARKLTQRKHRYRQNRFLVEGLQLLAMAVERVPVGKVRPLELFYCEELFAGETAPRLLEALTKAGADPIHVAAHVLDTLSEREVSQGLAGTFALRDLEWSLDEIEVEVAAPPALILVLDRLQDPGNLGTLVRTADAAGAKAVILLEPCVDPFDPKTVRGTMGSLFTVPFARLENPDVLRKWLSRLGCRAVGADAREGEAVWERSALVGSVALVLGNEARGLGPELRTMLTDYVGLPLLGSAESLNVAVAGGVLMYEWLRVNRGRES